MNTREDGTGCWCVRSTCRLGHLNSSPWQRWLAARCCRVRISAGQHSRSWLSSLCSEIYGQTLASELGIIPTVVDGDELRALWWCVGVFAKVSRVCLNNLTDHWNYKRFDRFGYSYAQQNENANENGDYHRRFSAILLLLYIKIYSGAHL